MSSLIIMSYKQPVEGNTLRIGAVTHVRDTERDPVRNKEYRQFDPAFKRSRNLVTVNGVSGPKVFYKERVNWSLSIPLVGGLLQKIGVFK